MQEGVNGLLVAADVLGRGHFTNYPGEKETVAVQVPFDGGRVPEYEVLHAGPCRAGRGQVIGGGDWAEEGGKREL